MGGGTAHFMDENFDTGEIIECRHFVIDSKMVNRDLVNLTYEKLFVLFMDIVNRILKQEKIEGRKQDKGRYFGLRELEEGKLIGKNESAEDILRWIADRLA